jgi:hypothetical protein
MRLNVSMTENQDFSIVYYESSISNSNSIFETMCGR